MTDKIFIKDLLLRGIIGINDWEREKKQDILINVTMFFNTKKAAETDDIDYALNYRTVCKNIIDLIDNSEFYLVEKLAEEIMKLCLLDQPAERAIVRVEKPQALRFADSVGIEIERTKSDFQ